MPVEIASNFGDLNNAWPLGTDPKSEGDDHIRLIKKLLKQGYPASVDSGFGARAAGSPANSLKRWVFNGKADLSGSDVIQIAADSGLISTISDNFQYNLWPGSDGNYRTMATGYGGIVALTKASGTFGWWSTSASVAAGGTVTPVQVMTVDNSGNLVASSNVTASGACFVGQPSVVVLAASASGGWCYLRPNGAGSTTGQVTLDYAGNMVINGNFVSPGSIVGGALVARAAGAGNANVTFQNNTTANTGYVYWNAADNTIRMQHASGGYAQQQPANFLISGQAYKPGGGAWVDSSDERIKTVTGDYTHGLDAIKALRPVEYVFRGNDTNEPPMVTMGVPYEPEPDPDAVPTVPYANSPHCQPAKDGTIYVGLIAQEVETALPHMVTRRDAYIDGAPVSDLRDLDTNSLIFTLVNAVKELAARLERLEATI